MEDKKKWEAAKKYLDEMRKAYTDIGVSGLFGLQMVINPLLIRYESGERTDELYDEIMGIK